MIVTLYPLSCNLSAVVKPITPILRASLLLIEPRFVNGIPAPSTVIFFCVSPDILGCIITRNETGFVRLLCRRVQDAETGSTRPCRDNEAREGDWTRPTRTNLHEQTYKQLHRYNNTESRHEVPIQRGRRMGAGVPVQSYQADFLMTRSEL
jgi:hypothetical protein